MLLRLCLKFEFINFNSIRFELVSLLVQEYVFDAFTSLSYNLTLNNEPEHFSLLGPNLYHNIHV